MIRTIEELSMNAWPALHTLLCDGWVLRFADGYTRRANCVNPLYAVEQDVQEKIAGCEQRYRGLGLPVIFKLTSACQPGDLDDRLAARGYRAEARTSVQLADLRGWTGAPSPAVSLSPQASAEWQAAFVRMHELSGASQITHQRMLGQILPQTCYASLSLAGQVAACGLAVLENGYLGLFDIITAADFRQRGCATQLVSSLLSWGRQQGAHTSYLQVMLNNPPALRLYEKLGFQELYPYWYRVA